MDDWDGLRVFLAVARAGRISAAAKRLAVEHTTVSRRISALEHDLGTALFYRTASGYRLTPVGEELLTHAEAMERAAAAAAARVREASGTVAGRVRVALIPELGSHWLAAHMATFHARYPAIQLEILVGTRPLDLSRGEADVAVRMPNPRQTGLVATRIADTAVGLYASKAFIGTKRLRITDAASARGVPLLVYLPQFGILQNAPWFRPVLAAGTIVLETNSTHTLLEAAQASAGVAVLPRLVVRGHDELVPVSDDVARTSVWLITHPEYRRDPKIRATADFLKQVAKGPAGLC